MRMVFSCNFSGSEKHKIIYRVKFSFCFSIELLFTENIDKLSIFYVNWLHKEIMEQLFGIN